MASGVLRSQVGAALAAGMNDLIAKPFDAEQLVGTFLRFSRGSGSASGLSLTRMRIGTDAQSYRRWCTELGTLSALASMI